MSVINELNRQLAENEIRMKREGWRLLFMSIGSGLAFLALSMTFGKLFFGG